MPTPISKSKKAKICALSIERCEGICYLCEKPFEKGLEWGKEIVPDHLDDDEKNWDVDNISPVHKECNYIKREFIDWKIKGRELYKKNQNSIDPELKKKIRKELVEMDKEMDYNRAYGELVQNYLRDLFFDPRGNKLEDEEVDFISILNAITKKAKKEWGTGSQVTIRRHLDAECSTEGAYLKERFKGRLKIKLRQ